MCTPVRALRKHGYVVIEGRPCKICNILTGGSVKSGKKYWLQTRDIFTDKLYNILCNWNDEVKVPIVRRKEYSLCDIVISHKDEKKFISKMVSFDDEVVECNVIFPIHPNKSEIEFMELAESILCDIDGMLCFTVIEAMGETCIIEWQETQC